MKFINPKIFRRLLLTVLYCKVVFITGQTVLTGTVVDKSNGKGVPFASIGIKGTIFGTVCDEDGAYKFAVKQFKETDTLRIAAIGYHYRDLSMPLAVQLNNTVTRLSLNEVQLNEVVIKPTKTVRKVLGNKKYNTNVYCFFTGEEGNYKGAEAAIKANNKKGRTVWIEDFNFYLMKNGFSDSVTFRLNFYTESKEGLPEKNILKAPIIFRTLTKQGVVTVNLVPYNITATGDFFISLECLEANMQKEMLSFSGSISGPSFFKVASFGNWFRSPLMGLDFNVTVLYQK